MEILTYKKVYQLVGDNASGTNECITKSAAVQIAESHRKNVTSNLSQYLNNEYIDVFAVEDKPDLSAFSFANNRYNPQAAGNAYTTAVSSRDIDGNTIAYNATADVDWITDIVINSTEIKFKVAANIGDQRTGHITGSNATGKSDTITIIQEAKEADLDYTYSLAATCTSVPTVTINGVSITNYTTSGNTYTFQYTTRVRTESEAPASVNFTISGGGAGDTYNEGTLSISPTSWDLDGGLSKQFTVGYSRVKTTKTWDHATGTIARNGSTSVKLNTTTATEYPTIDYTIRDTHPSGQSFSHSKNGMKFTSAASSTSCTGSITVTYGSLSATANVFYTEPTYDSYTYTVKASDANTDGTPTITINGQNATVTHSGGYYIGQITISDSATTSAPDSVSWSISGGTKATEWGSYNVSLSPDSWNLDDGLTKEFEVYLGQTGTKYEWRTTSGTVAKNREVSTDVTSSSTSFTGSEYSVSGPSGMTFSKSGTSFTATASSTGSTGTITVTCTESDANGESASCNVIYNPALKSWTYTVNVTCSERPTITIGGEDATVTGEINAWVGTRTIVAQEDPGEKSYYVTSGSSSRTWTDVHVNVSPSSITITEKPKDISFTAYAYQEYTEYSAYTASGTTSNKRAACKPTRDYSTGTSSSETCNISADNVSGLSGSMSISKDGTTVSGTANGSGSVTVSYSYGGYNDSATFSITYEEPEPPKPNETWPSWDDPSVTYTFKWDDNSTSISANGIAYDLSNESSFSSYKKMQVTSTRTRVSSLGNSQSESVKWDGGSQGWPTGNNTSTSARNDSGTLTQNHSGKTITWSWSQDGRPEGPTTGPYYSLITSSLSFTAEGGTQTAKYKRYYLKEGAEVNATELTYSVTADVLYSDTKRTWKESIGDTGLTIPCEQSANIKRTDGSIEPTSMSFTWEGGSKNAIMTTWNYYLYGDSDRKFNTQTYTCTVTVEKGETYTFGSQEFTHDGITKSVSWTRSSKPADNYEFKIKKPDGSTTTYYYTMVETDGTYDSSFDDYTIISTKNGSDIGYTTSTDGTVSGCNYSESTRKKTITYTQNETGDTITVSYTQYSNSKVWKSNSPINLQFPAYGGTKKFTIATWYEWRTHDNTFTPSINSQEKSITAEPNKTTTSKSWSTKYEQDGQTIYVYCKQDAETFPEKWSYVFTWDDGSSKVNGYFDVNGNEKNGGTYGSAKVISYRTKIGTAGTVKKEDVTYSGSKGSPSGVNMHDYALGTTGKLIQSTSSNIIEWQWTQDANEYVYGAECSALATYDGNGQFLHIANKTVSLTRAFKYGNDTQKQYDTEDANYRESVPVNPTVKEKTWTETYTASNGATYSVSYRQLGKLVADKTVTISVNSVSNTFAQYNVAFGASEALEKDITISYTVTYKKSSDQSFAYVSGSCVLRTGSTSVSDSGSLPISDIEPNSTSVSSMSASPSSYTNSYSGTTTISCDI